MLWSPPQTLFPPVLLWMWPNPLIDKRKECIFLFFELTDVLGESPRTSAGASLLSFSLLLRSVLKFHSVRTSLMRGFDLYFSKRWSFVFSDVCLTQRSSCESYSSKIGPKTFVPFGEIAEDSRGSTSCDTQPNCRASFNAATALLSPSFVRFFAELTLNLPVCKPSLIAEFTTRFRLIDLTFGRMPTVTR